jgi:glycosyltransferase involved in cell wall biosynthesis
VSSTGVVTERVDARNTTWQDVDAIARTPKTKPRVLLVTIPALGFASYAEGLATGLADQPDVETTHVSLQASLPQKALSRAFPGDRGWLNTSVRRRLLWRLHSAALARALRAGRFDAVHVAPQLGGLMAREAARAVRVPYSLGVDTTIALNQGPRPWPSSFEICDRYDRRSFAGAAVVAAWSRWAAASLRDDYGVRNIAVTPPALDVRSARVRPARTAGGVRIIFIGNDWARKGGERLVAWHQQHLRDTELHIVSRDAPRLGGLPGIVVHGSVPRRHLLDELLPSMDVLALPTSSDMSPFVLAEAAAAGVAAVATRIAGIPELVEHGTSGFLCPPGDDESFVAALRSLADDRALANRLGANARAFALRVLDARLSYRPIVDGLLAARDGSAS